MKVQTLGSSSDDVLTRGIPGGFSLETDERRDVNRSDIPGWGSDLDPAVRPACHAQGPISLTITCIRSSRARCRQSHHNPGTCQLTPVFGTSCPPRGVSGQIRDAAYRYSEGRTVRWIGLLFADRVDMVEGVVSDLKQLRPPNLVREMGLASEWRYNRPRVVKVAAVSAVLVGVAYLLLRRGRSR